jgi:flagellar biosynthesis protein FlhF
MDVKRYMADSMSAAMEAIGKDLGKDAVILSRRSVRRKGITGFFRRPMVEVMVAYDSSGGGASAPADQTRRRERSAEAARIERLMEELAEIRDRVAGLDGEEQMLPPVRGTAEQLPADPLARQTLARLSDYDVDEKIARRMVEQAWADAKEGEDRVGLVRREIIRRLGKPSPITMEAGRRHVIMVAGPTGAGKTTTLMKLAGLCLCQPGVKVGLINTDTFRIGAYDQVRIYSEIMEVPLHTAYTLEEMERAFKAQEDRDVILIDTAGKNSWDENYQENLQGLIRAASPDELLLVLSVNTSRRAIREILGNYAFVGSFKLIITKLDEVTAWGNVLNILEAAQKPLAYVTVGQSVPDDIEQPDVQRIADRILPEVKDT